MGRREPDALYESKVFGEGGGLSRGAAPPLAANPVGKGSGVLATRLGGSLGPSHFGINLGKQWNRDRQLQTRSTKPEYPMAHKRNDFADHDQHDSSPQ